MKKNKRTKTRDKLLSLSREESNRIGLEVQKLMTGDMKYLVNKYMFRYRNSVKSTWGWNDDDLHQHIMIILWKGVATFDAEKNIKMTTYLSTILYYQMGNLSKSIQNPKNSLSKFYCPEEIYDTENMTDFTTAEDWSIYAQSFGVLMGSMSQNEMKVLVAHLLDGLSLTQMQKKFKMKRPDLVGIIKSLTNKMEYYIGEQDEKNCLH